MLAQEEVNPFPDTKGWLCEEIQSTYLKSDRIKSLLNRVIKWEISDVLIYKVEQGRKGERKEAVSALSVVSRALTSVSINCELRRKYHCIKYNKPVKQSWGFRFPYCFQPGWLWLSSEPREVFVVCACFSREGSQLFRSLQFQIASDVLQRSTVV